MQNNSSNVFHIEFPTETPKNQDTGKEQLQKKTFTMEAVKKMQEKKSLHKKDEAPVVEDQVKVEEKIEPKVELNNVVEENASNEEVVVSTAENQELVETDSNTSAISEGDAILTHREKKIRKKKQLTV